MSNGDNPFKDVQNVLGFLIAGFAGILGFLGLGSAEVTSVLRNKSTPASLIALVLLLAVLAAVVTVGIPKEKKWPWLATVGLMLLALGIGALVIYAIPITSPKVSTRFKSYEHTVLRTSIGLLAAGAVVIFISFIVPWIRKKEHISAALTFILASVVLLAASIYGAMRLETDSQLTSSVQISASIAKGTSGAATLSVHVSGVKISTSGHVGLVILGLPSGINAVQECSRQPPQQNDAPCTRDPCSYLPECVVIFGAAVPPGSTGDINETLNDSIVRGKYQDIAVKASVCLTSSCNLVGSSGSRLDIHLSHNPRYINRQYRA